MANKKPTSKKRAPSASPATTKVTRIKASEGKSKNSTPTKPAAKKTTKTTPIVQNASGESEKKSWFSSLIGYFKGSWYELRQVHWPDRKNSWSMTLALIVFTFFFIAIILLLDALFQYLFSLALGK